MAVVIFTDLDASLLDHNGYGFAGAIPALTQIKARQIPLIAVTSKCRPEVERIRTRLGIDDPFIVENGAALYVPAGYRGLTLPEAEVRGDYTVCQWGWDYARIRSAFAEARQRFAVKGFGDMDVAEVARLTGLPLEDAALARQRQYSEPFLLNDRKRLDELRAWAAARDLAVVQGGRFWHLMSADQDKGRAVAHMTAVFRQATDQSVVSIGIGDSPNDASMLAVVDFPVLLPHPDGSVANLHRNGLTVGTKPGSHGWNDAVLQLLDTIAGRCFPS